MTIAKANIYPEISVLLPVYNGEKYLRLSIESILKQTFRKFELIIIDDGSSDNSVNIINEFEDDRIRLVRNPQNEGLIFSLNKGLSLANGEFVARQDADDIALPTRFEKQLALLKSSLQVAAVGSWISLIDSDGKDFDVWKYPENPICAKWAILFDSPIAHSSVMLRKNIVDELGGYSKGYKHAEDYELWSRINKIGQIISIPEVLQRYRIHCDGVSIVNNSQQNEMRINISKQNIRDIIGDDTSEETVNILSSFNCKGRKDDVVGLIDAYCMLLKRFKSKCHADLKTLAVCKEYCIQRIGSEVQRLSFWGRSYCLLKRISFFPVNYWLKLRFVTFILSDRAKNYFRAIKMP